MTTDVRPIQLSVVIACYNAGATLAEQLEALAAQPCPVSWELILADNGSTDDSLVVARRFADRLPLRILDAAGRRGAAHARNAGAYEAAGEWIAFCDADDIVGPTWLDAVCTAMRREPFVAGRVDVARLNSPRVFRSRRLEQREELQPARGNRLGLPHAGAGNMALHRSVFLGVAGFDEGLTALEDTDLCWRIQLAGTPLVFDRDMLLHTRLRSTLSGNFRQGYAYGQGHSRLEARHGHLTPTGGTPTAATSRHRGPLVSALESARTLRTVPSLGGLVWQVSWHLGRRSARRAGTADAPRPHVLPPHGRPWGAPMRLSTWPGRPTEGSR